MVNIQIPKVFLSGFTLLASISKEESLLIGEMLSNIPVGTGNSTFQQIFDSTFPKYSESTLATAIFSLATFKFSDLKNETSEGLAAIIVNAFKQQVEATTKESLSSLNENLAVLFNNLDRLYNTIKVFELLNENSRTFKEAKAISDIRLIFNEDINTSKRDGIILHNLKFTVQENEENKEYFFSLDTTDLRKLKEIIERAETKDKLLREQYADIISFITITE